MPADMRSSRVRHLLALPLLLVSTGDSAIAQDDPSAAEHRLTRIAAFLASDELAGRGLGTHELQRAAEFIHRELASLGLEMAGPEGDGWQRFDVTLDSQLTPGNFAEVDADVGGGPWQLDRDYRPLALGGPGEMAAPLVFAGYGITAPELGYDDYAGLDVRGRAVLLLRHEPRPSDPQSPFDGTRDSPHAAFRRKLQNAVDHGAAAVVFVNDHHTVEQHRQNLQQQRYRLLAEAADALTTAAIEVLAGREPDPQPIAEAVRRVARLRASEPSIVDPLFAFTAAGSQPEATIPVLFATRSVVEPLLTAHDQPGLADLEQQIDRDFRPQSRDRLARALRAHVRIEQRRAQVANVVAQLPGRGNLASEAVVVGAHCDHVGLGGPGSGSADLSARGIHNGADDNASGVAVLLELARSLVADDSPHRRRVVFVAFTGEERGLLGSAHYVQQPVWPLEQTVAMVNFDMVGRLTENRLLVNGYDTAAEFGPWLTDLNRSIGLELILVEGGLGPSDHATFYGQGLPVLHFYTGLHAEYHKPSDDLELLNVAGMRRIGELSAKMVRQIAVAPTRPRFTPSAGPAGAGPESVGGRP